jgi:hypothetical protein
MAFTIPLDGDLLRGLTPAEATCRLQRIVGSVDFEVLEDAQAVRILAPAVPYHALDPFLKEGLARLHPSLLPDGAASYRTRTSRFDLCLEDSWSGYFVAEWLGGQTSVDDVIFIHLDDHTDMMPSLLERRDNVLIDPADGQVFDVLSASDWEEGLASASVGIGSFVTALFYLPNRFHVRHINNYTTSDYQSYAVRHVSKRYPETRGREFAAIRKSRAPLAGAAGSYRGGRDPHTVLSNLPRGRIVVHIDLDYLINDFNGNPRATAWQPAPHAREQATRKLDTFFDALVGVSAHVERWIVAASPGFCSACHWEWMLERIERGIERVTGQVANMP